MLKPQSIVVDADADAAYVSFSSEPVARTEEIAVGIMADYAFDGSPVGLEVLSVRRRVGSGEAHSYLSGLIEGLRLGVREAAE